MRTPSPARVLRLAALLCLLVLLWAGVLQAAHLHGRGDLRNCSACLAGHSPAAVPAAPPAAHALAVTAPASEYSAPTVFSAARAAHSTRPPPLS